MVCLVNLDNPSTRYMGRIFWDMLRPGVKLAVMGPDGCCTSVIRQVVEAGSDRYVVHTKNSRYLLTTGRSPEPAELDTARGLGA